VKAVFLVFDNKFKKFFLKKYIALRTRGSFKENIVIITNREFSSLLVKFLCLFDKKVCVYKFPEIVFTKEAAASLSQLKDTRFTSKKFQFHKLNIFRHELKKYKKVFYMDVNMKINFDINPFFDLIEDNKLIASYDGDEDLKRKLKSQFDESHKEFANLSNEYDLETYEYFQSGLLLFNTSIINRSIVEDITKLINRYPLSITNEQGYLNIYFLYKNPIFVPLQNFKNKLFYTFWHHENNRYIITKRAVDYRYYLQRNISPKD